MLKNFGFFFFLAPALALSQINDFEILKEAPGTSAPNDTIKIDFYTKASQYYTSKDLEIALKYGDSAFHLANQFPETKRIVVTGVNLGYIYHIKGAYDNSIAVLHGIIDSLEKKKIRLQSHKNI